MAKAGTRPPRKPKKKLSKAEQSRRFIETAREIGTDESPEAFDRAFAKLDLTKKKPSKL
jgi:hypothetical protein